MRTFAYWKSINSFRRPVVSLINSGCILCYMEISFRTFNISWNTYFLNPLGKPGLMANTLFILALPSFRSLWLFPMSMLSFSPNADCTHGLPKTWCGILHQDCTWMHLKPAVWRASCMVCDSTMQANQCRRAQGLIAAYESSTHLRKDFLSSLEASGPRQAQYDQKHPSNERLALPQFVGPWPIILNKLLKRNWLCDQSHPKRVVLLAIPNSNPNSK